MKKIILRCVSIGILVLFTLQLIRCSFHSKVSDELILKAAGFYAVPGMLRSDLKGTESTIKIIETDSFGRTLFEMTTEYFFSQKRETVLVICQRFDQKYVCFYEDNCYLFPGYTTTDIDRLKSENDWEAPMAENKLSRREIHITLDLFLQINDGISYDTSNSFSESFSRQIEAKNSLLIWDAIADTDFSGHRLYTALIETETGEKEAYFYLGNADSGQIAVLKMEDIYNDGSMLAQFKKSNGWVYGY